MTYTEVRNILPLMSPRKSTAVCGTTSGRSRHIREGSPICPACRRAGSEYMKSRYWEDPQRAKEVRRTWDENHPGARTLLKNLSRQDKKDREQGFLE